MADAMIVDRPSVDDARHSYGAVVGWKLEPGGEQLQLVMQTVASRQALRSGDVDSSHMLLTRQQALQLANYLYAMTGETRPGPRKGPLSRLLG